MGTDLRETTSKDTKKHDGNIGPKTRSALQNAIKEGKLGEISKRFADKRLQHLKNHPDFWKFGKGWEQRVQSLRD